MLGIHLVNFRGNDAAGAVGSVFLLDAEILHFEAADGRGHPTILAAMIVDAAGLASFPTNGHALEDVVFEDEIAGVIALGEEEILVERFGANGVVEDIL